MNMKISRKYFFPVSLFPILYALSPAFAYELPSSTGVPHVFFESDEADFDRAADRLNLKGHVKLTEKEREGGLPGRIMKADEFTMFPSSHIAVSTGPVLVQEGMDALYGESGRFNTSTREGSLQGVSGVYGTWRVKGRSLDLSDKKHVYKKAVITSCDADKPHFHINVSKLSVVPKRRLLGYNALFFLGDIPVFYSPFFYKPVKSGEDQGALTTIQPGYDSRNGAFVKTTTLLKPGKKSSGKLFLDYMSNRGVGMGAEVNYNDPDNFRGSFSGYRISDSSGALVDRWGVTGGHWMAMKKGTASCSTCAVSANYFSQSQFRLLSDTQFNNDFFRSNPFAVSADMNASMAVVRQTAKTTTRLSFSRQDNQKPGTVFFQKAVETRPRLDFNTAPILIKGVPLVNTFSAYFDNTQYGENDVFHKTGGARFNTTRTVRLVKGLNLTPSAYYDQTVIFGQRLADGSDQKQKLVGRYGTGVNLRYDSLIGTLDLTHSYVRRLKADSFSVDSEASDRGEEANLISFENFIRPSRQIFARVASAYDLRHSPAYSPARGVERVRPIIGEIGYTPNPDINVFARNEFDLIKSNRAFFIQADVGNIEKNHMGLGISHYSSSPSDYIINQTAAWRPQGSSWRLELFLRYIAIVPPDMPGGFRTLIFFAKGLTIYKDFHDFRTRWNLNYRPGGVREISFQLDLKMNDPTRKRLGSRESDDFWRPWRRELDVRD